MSDINQTKSSQIDDQLLTSASGTHAIRKKSKSKMVDTVNSYSSTYHRCWQLTPDQRNILMRTWSDDFDFLYQLGTHIYVYIFDHQPKMKTLFPAIHAHGDAWKESSEFRSQALKFVQTISLTIKNIYHIDTIEPILHDIGKAHCRFAIRGFKPHYWDVSQVSRTDNILIYAT
jgi:hypothetical protein